MNIIIEISPSGYFFVLPRTVGLTDAEVAKAEHGTLSSERFDVALEQVRQAMFEMSSVKTEGSC